MAIDITFDFRTDTVGKNPDPDASSFAGYVDFWLLDDLVDPDGAVKLFLPSENFTLSAVPRNLADYLAFCERTIEFVTARNERIRQLGL